MEVSSNWEFYKHLMGSCDAAAVTTSHHLPLGPAGHKLPSTGWDAADCDDTRQHKEPFEGVCASHQMEDDSDQSSCTSSLPDLTRDPTEDNNDQSNCTPSLPVLSGNLEEGNSERSKSPSLLPVLPNCVEGGSEWSNKPPSLPVLPRHLTEGNREQSNSHPSLSVLSSSLMENDSDRGSCPSSLPALPWHVTVDDNNQRNCSSSLSVSPPSTPLPSNLHHTPASQNPTLPASEPQTPECPRPRTKKRMRKEHCDEDTDSELNVPSEGTAPPPYSYCIASAVENILIDCPEDTRRECGQLILTAAVKILMDLKKQSVPLTE